MAYRKVSLSLTILRPKAKPLQPTSFCFLRLLFTETQEQQFKNTAKVRENVEREGNQKDSLLYLPEE